MQRFPNILCSFLLVALAGTCGCCCPHLHHLPDDCAAAVYECDLACLLHDFCSCQPLPCCGSSVSCDCCPEDEPQCESCPLTSCPPLDGRRCLDRIEVGPAPVTYRPELPPKFLPVPSRPVFSTGIALTPVASGGSVEVGFGPQLSFPGSE